MILLSILRGQQKLIKKESWESVSPFFCIELLCTNTIIYLFLFTILFFLAQETYYIPGSKGSNPRGKLFSHINYIVQKSRRIAKEEENRFKPIVEEEAEKTDPEVEAAISWLEINSSPWATVLTQWEISFPGRKKLLRQLNKSQQLVQTYHHLCQEFGYQLVSCLDLYFIYILDFLCIYLFRLYLWCKT